MEFLRSLLRRPFVRAQVATSRDVGCWTVLFIWLSSLYQTNEARKHLMQVTSLQVLKGHTTLKLIKCRDMGHCKVRAVRAECFVKEIYKKRHI